MFGKAFASKPDQFQFFPGNRTVIEVIYEISKNLVDAMVSMRRMKLMEKKTVLNLNKNIIEFQLI